jgi:hypothetical protein
MIFTILGIWRTYDRTWEQQYWGLIGFGIAIACDFLLDLLFVLLLSNFSDKSK